MNMTRGTKCLASGIALAALSFSVVAAAAVSQIGGGSAGFHAIGPGGLNIDGKTSDVKVSEDGGKVVVVVGLGSISTGMGLRDGHAKEDLDVEHFPTATIKVDRGQLKFPSGGESSGDAKGSLTIHGQTRDVSFHYTAAPDGDGFKVSGSTKVNIDDFGVKRRSYLGISIKPEVEITVNFKAKDG